MAYLSIFFARTSRTSHFKSILSPRDASLVLRGRLPFMSSLPLLLTRLSNEVMHSLFDFTWTVPPTFVSGFRSTGDNTEALWNVANPSSTGCSTVPLTCLIRKKNPIKKKTKTKIRGFQRKITYIRLGEP